MATYICDELNKLGRKVSERPLNMNAQLREIFLRVIYRHRLPATHEILLNMNADTIVRFIRNKKSKENLMYVTVNLVNP